MSYIKQFAPDGQNFIKQGKTDSLVKAIEWLQSYEVTEQLALNPFAVCRVRGTVSGEVLGERKGF